MLSMPQTEVVHTSDTACPTYRATLQHVGLLATKRRRLQEAQIEAERQLLRRIAQDYLGGALTFDQLQGVYREYRDVADSGFSLRWNQEVPVRHDELVATRPKAPNGPGGEWWSGVVPLGSQASAPPHRQSVVYVLYDGANSPCYVGSTDHFRARLKRHCKDGKPVAAWMAYPVESRADAYALEDRLLKEHKPYLNKRAGR